MKNFKVVDKESEKEYWISRASAVVGIVYGLDKDGEPHFLVSKRGPGCPDHVGKWAFTCGYLDWDETKKEAVVRELWEELGLLIQPSLPRRFCEIDDPGRDKRQNLVTRYLVRVDLSELQSKLESGVINKNSDQRGGESGEVGEIRLVTAKEVGSLEWAFGIGETGKGHHGEVLMDAWNYIKRGVLPDGAE